MIKTYAQVKDEVLQGVHTVIVSLPTDTVKDKIIKQAEVEVKVTEMIAESLVSETMFNVKQLEGLFYEALSAKRSEGLYEVFVEFERLLLITQKVMMNK